MVMMKKIGIFRNFSTIVKERVPLSVVTHFFVYAAGKFFISGISCIMAPLMMVLLTPAEYGLVSLLHGSNNVVIACLGLGLPQVLMVNYFQVSGGDRGYIVNSVLCAYCMISVPLMSLVMLYPRYVQQHLFLTGQYSSLVYAVILICFLSFFNDIMLQILQYNRAIFWYSVIQILVGVLTALFNIFVLMYCRAGVAGVVWVEFALVLAVFLVGIYLYCVSGYYKMFNLPFVLKTSWEFLVLGIPFLPGLMSGWLLALMNRWMLAYYMGLDSVGIYSVADAGGLLIYRLILYPLQGSYGPFLFDSYSNNARDIRATEQSNHMVMGLVILGMVATSIIGYVAFGQLAYVLVPEVYKRSVDCILGILLGYAFLIGAYFVSNFLQFQRRRAIFALALCSAVIMNGALNAMCIPQYGLQGCVCSMMIGCGTYFFVLWSYNWWLLRTL
jgi:O-antigen/teichoic acid export membrane protein